MTTTELKLPEELTRGLSFDAHDFFTVKMDTVVAPPADRALIEQRAPGTCVKTGDTGRVIRNEALCGIVSKNEAAGAVVVGHGWLDADFERFVWRGSRAEFQRLWEVD